MVASIGPMAETNKKIREIKVPEKIFKNEFQKLKILSITWTKVGAGNGGTYGLG